MSREFPDYIDPWKAADGRRSFHGTMPVRRMQRLLPLLEQTDDGSLNDLEASFDMVFGHDEQGLVVIDVGTRVNLPLLCQRSMRVYSEAVDRFSRLVIITRMEEADEVPEAYDPVIVAEGRLALLDVIEEELLLAVPQVPRDPKVAAVELSTGGDEAVPPTETQEQTHQPFAGLAGLMKGSSDD